jgi:hypothetical protein
MNILFAFGEVKPTIRIPIVIVTPMYKINTHTAVAVGCVDQHEYSLMKILYIHIMIINKKRESNTMVLDSLEDSSFF